MYQSKLYIPFEKDVTKQAVAKSHIYSLRSGLVHQTAAGIYSYLPYAVMMLNNIEAVVREEIYNIGANEVILPLLEPAELWEKTGRWQSYGDELFRVTDRKNTKFALAPTHEEVMVDLVKNQMKSYKKYPLNLFQIGTKMRDEARPRFGLLRGREFIMFDGYSFHADDECLMNTYNEYYEAYKRILNRLNIEFKIVTADNGQMGGQKSHEFMAIADIGEDTICYTQNDELAYNIEIAPILDVFTTSEAVSEIAEVTTVGIKTIEEVSSYLNTDTTEIIKTIAVDADGEVVLVLVRGDYEVNDIKLAKILGVNEVVFATEEMLSNVNLVAGYLGSLNTEVKMIVDNSVKTITNGVMGANKVDTHVTGVNFMRDINCETVDVAIFKEGDFLTESKEEVHFSRGIEVGHIFALGQKYALDLDMKFLTKEQKNDTATMGCYGMGISRLISAIIEQNNDEAGLLIPRSVSPFTVHLLPLDYNKKEIQKEKTDELKNKLQAIGIKVLVDDRDERPGVKFSQADLLGIPYQVVIGRDIVENKVEFKVRATGEKMVIDLDDVIGKINEK